jgi:23S rRNA (cytosine1962-C5)-methyltransferase
MDPPAYGRGSGGDMWEIESGLTALVESCVDLLSETAFGFIVNTYATEISTYSIENIFKSLVSDKLCGNTEAFELGLPISTMRGSQKLVLPTGMVTRWFR